VGSGGAFFQSPDPGLVGSALSILLMFESVTEADLHEYRFGFEQENAELAAVRATDEQRAQLLEFLDEARCLRDEESATRWFSGRPSNSWILASTKSCPN
jgi:DNA-binding FadR family transcriptional regulator